MDDDSVHFGRAGIQGSWEIDLWGRVRNLSEAAWQDYLAAEWFRRGVETCMRFTAQHAWHFDTLAPRIPDTSYARQPSGGLRGSCEPWQMN